MYKFIVVVEIKTNAGNYFKHGYRVTARNEKDARSEGEQKALQGRTEAAEIISSIAIHEELIIG